MEDSAPIEAGSASLQKVRKRYDTLTDLIGSLSSKLNNVSVHQEKDFLLAYRVHQVDIQQELKELKPSSSVVQSKYKGTYKLINIPFKPLTHDPMQGDLYD